MTRITPVFLAVALLAGLNGPGARAAPEAKDPKAKTFVELGRIPWHRDQAHARARAKASGKPLMVFSTELPGCNSCKLFGEQQLSHPLVVDAAAHFVPLALATRTWPTMFFRTAEGKDLVSKVGYRRRIGPGPLLDGMERALQAAKRPVPPYLALAAAEYRCRKPQRATFAMACFWTGEARLAGIDGVISSRCGFLRGEVVELTFDPKVVSYQALVAKARKLSCARTVVARTDQQLAAAGRILKNQPKAKVIRSDAEIRPAPKDTKYYLRRHRRYWLLPLTERQAGKCNSALGRAGGKPEQFLSPSQLALLNQLKSLSDKQVKAISLIPDRSADGLGAYAAALTRALQSVIGNQ